ncbi:hypothetical protein [Kiloniella sp.]|uniref:hypothetical protein n=1 Tax=Kiloniella sp. TaxID=1938587 RepID=UPI003B0224F7
MGVAYPVLPSGKNITQIKVQGLFRGWFVFCFLIFAFGGIFSPPFSAYASSSEIDPAIESLYSDDRYQNELPLEIKETKVEKKSPPQPLRKEKNTEKTEKTDLSALEFLGKILMYGFLALAGVLIVKAIYNYINDLKRRPQNKIVLEENPAAYSRVTDMPEELSKETLGYADLLAEKGQFEAAIRALLFCCLKHVKDSYHSRLPAALTNREILKADWLPSDVRLKMSVIVEAEELTEFGGRSAGVNEYSLCREAFHIFVNPERSSSAGEGGTI